MAPTFLTSALEGFWWSDSGPCRFTPGKQPLYQLCRSFVGPRASLDVTKKRKISCRCQESNIDSLAVLPVVWSLYRLRSPGSMQDSILWGITRCSTLKVNRRFGGTWRMHLPAACYLLHGSFLVGLSFVLKVGGDMFFRNVGWLSTDYKYRNNFTLHGVTSQKTELCDILPFSHT
jgi:hypothetical protein